MFRLKIFLALFFAIPFLLVLSSNVISHAQVTEENTMIWYPRGTTPIFILAGDTFTVEVKTTEDLPTTGWKAKLFNDLKSWNVTVLSVEKGKINANREKGYKFTIKSSENLPPELLSIELKRGSSTLTSTRSVKIETDFDESFYILHISDEHMSLRDGDRFFNIKDYVAPTINLINPRFALYTGDCMVINFDSGTPDDPKWIGTEEAEHTMKLYREKLLQYTAPTVVIPGNHDTGWMGYQSLFEARRLWDEIMGQRALSFRMGTFYVGCVEWTLHDYYNWSYTEFRKASKDESLTYLMLASHGYDGPGGWTTVTGPIDPADIMLVGHGHSFRTVAKDPYPVFMSGASREYYKTGFFNFMKDGDTWTCPQVQSRLDGKDYFNLYDGDNGANPIVSSQFENENDGTAISNQVTITNRAKQDFYNGRIRFLMKKGNYKVEGGEVLSQYNYGNNNVAVVVKVNIKADATTTLNISKTDSDIDSGKITIFSILALGLALSVFFVIKELKLFNRA